MLCLITESSNIECGGISHCSAKSKYLLIRLTAVQCENFRVLRFILGREIVNGIVHHFTIFGRNVPEELTFLQLRHLYCITICRITDTYTTIFSDRKLYASIAYKIDKFQIFQYLSYPAHSYQQAMKILKKMKDFVEILTMLCREKAILILS